MRGTTMTSPAEEYLTVPEAAARLKVGAETVRVWLRQGKLRGSRPGGTKAGYRIPQSEVDRVLRGEPSPERGDPR
jgi:excisionase family DNA binding protein